MESKYLKNIEKIDKCDNFSIENKEKLKKLYYYIYNRDTFKVYYPYTNKEDETKEFIVDLIENPDNNYLEVYLTRGDRRYRQIWLKPICFDEVKFSSEIKDLAYRIDYIKESSFSLFWKDLRVVKSEEIKDPFNNIKETAILKERVLNLDLEE